MAIKCPECETRNPDTQKYCGERGNQLTPVEDLPSGTKTLETPREEFTRGTTIANRCELIEELGRGGLGRVYRVYDKELKEDVALKLIKPEIFSVLLSYKIQLISHLIDRL